MMRYDIAHDVAIMPEILQVVMFQVQNFIGPCPEWWLISRALLLTEVSPGQQCTLNFRVLPKKLVPQHAQLHQVEALAKVGEMPI